MKIVTVRKISQVFFFTLFVWFCVVATFGTQWRQLRGWPVNWFLQLDPLVAIGTALTTHTLYWPLLWALAVIVLTVLLGRFFCSWVCPFGSIHHFVSYLGLRKRSVAKRIELNKYRKAQATKYVILIVILIMAAVPIGKTLSLQIGLLDPIPLVSRSFTLVLLPIADSFSNTVFVSQRFYDGAWFIGTIFLASVALNLIVPRFYCRFICPLGALFGILDRFALWRIGKAHKSKECTGCKLCEGDCHGGCEPAGKIRLAECVLCFNCLDECQHELIAYQTHISKSGEIANPDISRRGLIFSGMGGLAALPFIRLSNKVGANWHFRQIRPPGSLAEEEFLKRCLKCGQCMRICPTNVIQPAGIEGGIEALWTPVLNNRIGSSGCQLNCVACGYICPTAAIRPITLSEKLGVNDFAKAGPIRLGTAFVDQSRCLPWSMDKPCIVCQENCPVSPKAIFTREYFRPIRFGNLTVERCDGTTICTDAHHFKDGAIAGGDYYCRPADAPASERRKIVANAQKSVTIDPQQPWKQLPAPESNIIVEVRLQRPYVDIEACIGCGICEHECPVSGLRAIRVSAEGETRSTQRRLLLKS
jgi:ferredoxin/polyferredoxin